MFSRINFYCSDRYVRTGENGIIDVNFNEPDRCKLCQKPRCKQDATIK